MQSGATTAGQTEGAPCPIRVVTRDMNTTIVKSRYKTVSDRLLAFLLHITSHSGKHIVRVPADQTDCADD